MFILKEGTCIFFYMRIIIIKVVIFKFECIDEEMWEMGWVGFVSLFGFFREDCVGGEVVKFLFFLKIFVLFYISFYVICRSLKRVYVRF